MARVHAWSARVLVPIIAFSLVLGSAPHIAIADDDIALEPVSWSGSYTPLSADPSASVLVTIRLSENPVAVEQANAGRKLSDGEKSAIKSRLQTSQSSLVSAVAARGGTVEAQFQSAINAVKVRIASSQLAALAALPGVVGIDPVELMVPANSTSVPYIGAPQAWETTGFRGEGIKVAIIDTGIDYMHANFGGPGSHGSYVAFNKKDDRKAAPGHFGPNAPKVKGGIDLAGDAYTGSNTPQPDPNPLDCNGHGSHVAGTAAGFGVLNDGTRYEGTYDSAAYAGNPFRIGPGVAPLADLYAVRVFGCSGSTGLTVDAIDWAVDNDMDVINMSLGSAYGRPDNSSAIAADNAAAAGIIVVASSGNSGAAQYITGSPAVGLRAISVAANDSTQSFPGAILTLTKGASTTTVEAINANGATFADGSSWPIHVLRSADGTVSLGCNEAEYDPAVITGKLVVTQRGLCARVARAVFAQKYGGAAAAMINNSAALPPFEGPITGNPDTGEQFNVTIPFFGVRGLASTAGSDGDKLQAAGGGTAAAVNTLIANPGFEGFASFSSGGPRTQDSFLKPDITAPGVSTNSTNVGTGDGASRASGTSMAAPHVAGVAALTKQAHPGWSQDELRAAIVNTGSPARVAGYRTSRGGTGLVQPLSSTRTSAVALTTGGSSTLNFGFTHVTTSTYTQTRMLTITNKGTSPLTFTPAATSNAPFSRAHTVTFSAPSVTVAPGGSATLGVTLNASASALGNSVAAGASFNEVAGLVVLTPAAGQNNDIALRSPYYLVPRASSNVNAEIVGSLSAGGAGTVKLTNPGGPIQGFGELFTWGIEDADEADVDWHDLRAVGVRALDNPGGRIVQFAVNTWDRHSSPSTGEYDIHIDRNADGTPEFIVFSADFGLVTAGAFNGQYVSFVHNVATGVATAQFNATAPTDSSTVILTVFASAIGLSAAEPSFSYRAVGFNFRGNDDNVLGETGRFRAFGASAISMTTSAQPVAPNATVNVPFTTNATEWAQTPPKGILVVVRDNVAGAAEVRTLPAGP